MTSSTILALAGVGYLLTWLLIPWVLLKRTVHASSALAWILAIVFVPYLGALLFCLVGTTRWNWRATGRRAAVENAGEQAWQLPAESTASDEQLRPWNSLARLAAGLAGVPVASGNDVTLLPEMQRSFEVMEQTVERAQAWVHIEFYIWRSDGPGTRFRDLLIRKAQSGVQVRFLYDGVGSMQLSRSFLRPLRKAGVEVIPFAPGFRLWNVLTLNLRNHRKLIVTDQQAAFTGGMNIGSEYLHPTKSYGTWRDTQLLVEGPAAWQFQQVFVRDWFYATGEKLAGPEFCSAPQRRGAVPVQTVADGPDNETDAYYMLAVAALGQAQERVTMTTPYFVPPNGLAVALATAARRGVRVRLMVARRGNFRWTLHAGRSYYGPLLAAGVEIYEYEKGIYHPKTLTVDGQWSLVGTPNWDFRSLYLNFELAASLFDRAIAEQLEAHFEHDLESAHRIDYDQWQQRSRLAVLQEEFWRLFAPSL